MRDDLGIRVRLENGAAVLQAAAQAGGIVSMNVPTALGLTFTNNTTVQAVITNAPGTAVAGNMRILVSSTATP